MESAAKEPAAGRILNAARHLVSRGGAAAVSMGEVAQTAGVSKALVHYHFKDKDTLLQALVAHVGAATLEREHAAVAAAATTGHALDDLWRWLEAELQSGDIHILGALAEYGSEPVRERSRDVAARRRTLAAEHVTAVFDRLGLTPRVPPRLVADTVVVFIDGLAASRALDPERDPRPAFDVLWLALLTLVE